MSLFILGTSQTVYGKKEIKVKVDNVDEKTKLATVHIGDATDKTFKVSFGALTDIPKEEEKPVTSETTEETK